MGAAHLLNDLLSRGLNLVADGDKLRVRGKLTEDDRAAIRAHKAELLAVLTGHRPAEPVQAPQSSPAPVSAIPPALVHIACSACVHLDGGYCIVRGYSPDMPLIPMRLCGRFEVRELGEDQGKREGGA
jgi:hypothetical protein